MKRKWFQIHLFTFVLVFVLCALDIYLNIVGSASRYWYTKSEEFIGHTIGFPVAFGQLGILKHFTYGNARDFFELDYSIAILDAVIGSAALIMIGVATESFIRRREAHTY